MATVDSPRRVLGERDVNTPLLLKHSSISISPSKAASLSYNNALHEKTLDLGKLSQTLLSPKTQHASTYPKSISSTSGSRKREAACLGDAQDDPPRKQAIIDLPQDNSDVSRPRTGNSKTRSLQSPVSGRPDTADIAEAAPGLESLRQSLSPDSSFDTTQDSELLDSQLTNITEPEDPTALTIVPLLVTRVVTQEEARENAEALRLRLKVAMYKVKTRQTDVPLSQLQIRSSRAYLSRTLLPSSRLAPAPNCSKPVTPTSHLSRVRNDEVDDHISVPSVSPPQPIGPDPSSSHAHEPRRSNFATPILPRSREGYSRVHDSRGSPEPGPEVTSSIVKGRAADGLLSLMGSWPCHA